jgi:hypothetical protein
MRAVTKFLVPDCMGDIFDYGKGLLNRLPACVAWRAGATTLVDYIPQSWT